MGATVYIDNNIIVSIEDGSCSLDQIRAIIPGKKVRFFYSSAHIFEVEHFPGHAAVTKSELLEKRFHSIREITKKNYLYLNLKGNQLTQLNEDPKEVYNTITDVPFAIEAMKGFLNLYTKEQKEAVRKELGIEIHKLNNYSASEIIEHLNTKLTAWGTNQSFIEMIEYGIKVHPDGKSFGLHNRIAGVFELLDMLGYWKDKETDTSNYARLWDAQHTFFASYCNYFISDDRRTRNKAEVAYKIYNKDTKVISSI